MRPALDSVGHRVPRTKPTHLLHTWRPHQQRPFTLVIHMHQHQSSCNLHLQYLANNHSTQSCQSLITLGSDHPPVLKPHRSSRGTHTIKEEDMLNTKMDLLMKRMDDLTNEKAAMHGHHYSSYGFSHDLRSLW
jgi:hypothetical protein